MNAPQSSPRPRFRQARGGPLLTELAVGLEVAIPILGGSFATRAVDDIDVIRPATVRGHLRFWWRALYAHEFQTSPAMYRRESELWGCSATESGRRSAVEMGIKVEQVGELDQSDIRLYDSKEGKATPGAYALWTARAVKERGQVKTPPAPRRKPGTRFRVRLVVPQELEHEARSALRAWILFGGYGSRTRRGLGSPRVLEDAGTWLPRTATRDAFTQVFGRDIFAPGNTPANDVPRLAGASLHVGTASADALGAWCGFRPNPITRFGKSRSPISVSTRSPVSVNPDHWGW